MIEATQAAPARSGTAAILVFCFLAILVEGYDIQAIGVAGPRMIPALGLSPAAAGVLFSASLLGMIPGALLGGAAVDRFGRRTMIVASLVIFGAFTLATGWISHLGGLIVVRLAAGLGLGAAMPVLMAVAADSVAPARRAALVTTITAGMPLGAALAALSGRFLLLGDWRMIFVVGGLTPIMLAMLALPLVPAAVGRADARTASDAAPDRGPLAPAWRAVTIALALAYLFTLMALLLLMNWLPLLLAGIGQPLAMTGQLAFDFNLGGVAGGLLLGLAALRWPPKALIAATFALLTVTLLALGWTTHPSRGLAPLLAAAGFLLMGGQCLLYGLAAAVYPTAIRVRGMAVAISAGRVGAVFGPLTAGALVTAGFGLSGVLAAVAAFVALAGIGAVAADGLHRHRLDRSESFVVEGIA